MTIEISLTLGILFIAIVLFASEMIRADLVALMVLVTLVIVRLVTPEEGISGFANPAVVTIWAVFILSAGLSRTGVAAMLGRKVLQLAGHGENRLLTVLISSTAILSGFMNNIGVAAMFLPVTLDIARRTKRPASLLLMPMAYGSLFGGMLVLIGTASNLVISNFIREEGLRPLRLFDFTPIGAVILLVALVYMVLLGRRLLPRRNTPSVDNFQIQGDFKKHYELEERLAIITIPEESLLAGKTLAESRFGKALGLNILSVMRKEGVLRIPETDLELFPKDRLLVLGRLDTLNELSGRPVIVLDDEAPEAASLISDDVRLVELEITDGSIFNGKTMVELEARQTLGINLLAVQHEESLHRTYLRDIIFEPGDRILLQGPKDRLEALRQKENIRYLDADQAGKYSLEDRLLYLQIPEGSPLAGNTIKELNLPAGYGISVLKVIRNEAEQLMPDSDTTLEEDDLLIVGGRPGDIETLRGHQTLLIDRNPDVDLRNLETDTLSVVEVILSPHTAYSGKTLREINFREKYGVSVLAIWRGNRSYRTNLADIPLEFGDALLCYGTREKFEVLARDQDFVVLRLDLQEKLHVEKAPLSGLIMAGVLAVVLLNWLPIYIAAIAGASLMILTRCLTLEEAYRAIEWKAVFLIAAMLPMGLAMQQTGAALMFADAVINALGPYGPTAILAGIMTLTLVINQFIPSAVNAVVMTPIAIATAAGLGVSPYPFVMGIAYAVAASFMTPVSHPVNVLVMTPGGYRFGDYIKNGLPLSIIVLVVSVLLLPIIFPY